MLSKTLEDFQNQMYVGGRPDNVEIDSEKENYDQLNDFNELGQPMKPGYSFFGKPIRAKQPCRSMNAILRAENEIEAIDRKIRMIEEQRLAH